MLTTRFNMIELNILRLIDISSKKDFTVGAYAFRTSFLVKKLMIFLPRSFLDQILIFVLARWASLIFTSQLEGIIRICINEKNIYGKLTIIISFLFFFALYILFKLPHLYLCIYRKNNKTKNIMVFLSILGFPCKPRFHVYCFQ